jgi:hypothetical protein
MRSALPALAIALPALLVGCDLLGIEGAAAVAARREAEGKAIGGACRHAARSIEACYTSNKKADKAAIFAGWREMNDYMRENKIEAMPAPEPPAPAAEAADGESGGDEAPGRKPGAKPAADGGKTAAAGKPASAKPH